MTRSGRFTLLWALLALAAATAGDDGYFDPDPNAQLYTDGPGDLAIRRTSADPLPFDPPAALDLLQYRVGNWNPVDPAVDLFEGEFYPGPDKYARIDLLLNGRVNPPGPQAPGDFDPFLYGSRPLYGVLELNVDLNFNTGGELDRAQDYMMGNIGRFGSRLYSSYAERTARRFAHTQMPFVFDPQTKRTGHDFELYFGGQEITSIDKRVGDGDDRFERGETWVITGNFFCRAHGYEFIDFWSGSGSDGIYCPEVQIRFSHSISANKTTVSFVFPMINFTEPNDFDDENEVSIMEALEALVIAAQVPSGNPEDALIEDWAGQYPIMYSGSTMWNIKMITSTSYRTEPTDDQYFVWTDIAPNNLPGDFDGDNDVDVDDVQMFDDFVETYDGNPEFDTDGNPSNGSLTIPNYPRNFCIYDPNYDGVVNSCDTPLSTPAPGDFNCDGVVDCEDFALLADCLSGPDLSAGPACHATDLDGDGDVDLADFTTLQTAAGSP